MRVINHRSVLVVGRCLKSSLKMVTMLCLLSSLIVPALAAEGESEDTVEGAAESATQTAPQGERVVKRPRGYQIRSNSALYGVMTTADAFQGGGGQSGSGGDKAQGGAPPGGDEVADNGTNPASFGFKFMPYYRYTELDNGIKSIEDLTLFALFPLEFISPFSAIVLEWPVRKTFDAGELAEDFALNILDGISPGEFPGGLPFPCGPPACAGGDRKLPVEAFVRGFDTSGFGDLRLRYLQGIKMFGNPKQGKTTVLMVGLDVMFPTASDPILGDETYYGSPIFAHVHNLNQESFFAFLHFYFFDWAEKSGAEQKDIGFYMGRYFFQKAWSESGYYLLPEVQVIYDSESDNDWSAMFLPELGKTFMAGGTALSAYIKPGWGINADPTERSFSVEMGLRFIPLGK